MSTRPPSSVPSRRALAQAALVATPLVLAGACGAYLLRDPMPHFVARRASLASAVEGPTVVEGGFALTPVRVTGTSGLAVDLTVRRALADGDRPLPLVLVLGGHHTGQAAARMVGDTRGVVVAGVSYPFTGDPRPDAATFLREIPKIRAAFLDTPPALMLALDHLLRRPGVDTASVDLVGVSLGAPFVCIAGALDERFTRVWVMHGSGGSYAPLEASMRRSIRPAPVRALAAVAANVVIAGPRLDPVKWVGRIAPRPFVMVSARDEERLPRHAVESLFDAAREPKERIWMSGRHVRADSATVLRLVGLVLARVRGPGAP